MVLFPFHVRDVKVFADLVRNKRKTIATMIWSSPPGSHRYLPDDLSMHQSTAPDACLLAVAQAMRRASLERPWFSAPQIVALHSASSELHHTLLGRTESCKRGFSEAGVRPAFTLRGRLSISTMPLRYATIPSIYRPHTKPEPHI